MNSEEEWPREALCAVDLGLGEFSPPAQSGEIASPRVALARNLTSATERLLQELRKHLEAAGVSPYGQPTRRGVS